MARAALGFETREEMQHTGDDFGGVLSLVVWILFSPVSAFLLASEVGEMYKKEGQEPFDALTGTPK
jgi:hypothetical protein